MLLPVFPSVMPLLSRDETLGAVEFIKVMLHLTRTAVQLGWRQSVMTFADQGFPSSCTDAQDQEASHTCQVASH